MAKLESTSILSGDISCTFHGEIILSESSSLVKAHQVELSTVVDSLRGGTVNYLKSVMHARSHTLIHAKTIDSKPDTNGQYQRKGRWDSD